MIQESPNSPNLAPCLICRSPLDADTDSVEHIIPNALGGRISCKNATCGSCNNNECNAIELPLIKSLSGIALLLDLPRDRGSAPPKTLSDEKSGKEYNLLPGQSPKIAHNLAVDEVDGKRTFSVFTPEGGDGSKIFRQLGIKAKGDENLVEKQTSVELGKPTFPWEF